MGCELRKNKFKNEHKLLLNYYALCRTQFVSNSEIENNSVMFRGKYSISQEFMVINYISLRKLSN